MADSKQKKAGKASFGSGSVDAGQLVRLKKGKTTFEVITNEGSALKFREEKCPWESVMVVDIIFKNFSRGLRASDKEIQ
jgi:ribosome maturation protein Sdo1